MPRVYMTATTRNGLIPLPKSNLIPSEAEALAGNGEGLCQLDH